jgi:hypothetical protein
MPIWRRLKERRLIVPKGQIFDLTHLEARQENASPKVIVRALDLCVLQAKTQFVSDHLLIANFIGPKPKLGFLEP